jgi:capsular polysaccharide biosynthesis protein
MLNRILNNGDFDSSGFIYFLYKWRQPLIIITIIAIIISIIFSSPFFITPKYKSTVILFPTSSNSISQVLLGKKINNKKDILEFGEDEQTERMLQILNSNKIKDRIIEKYNLGNHYGINKNKKYFKTKINNEYESNISFRRTEYMAVKISVLDKDPQMAADIANDISILLDSTINDIKRDRSYKGFIIVENEYIRLKSQIKEVEDSLKTLRKLGVHDYESQAEMINQQLAIEIAKGNKQSINRLEEKLDILANYGGAYVTLRDALEYDIEQLSIVKTRYEDARIDAQQVLPQKFIVNHAFKAEKKSYPIRWLFTVFLTFSVLFLSILVIIIIENYEKIKNKKKENF